VQGADVEALISAGDHVTRFACVVGEFDKGAYNVPKSIETDPVPFLKSHGFAYVIPKAVLMSSKKRGVKVSFVNSVWVNTRFYERFKKREYMCQVMEQGVVQSLKGAQNTKIVGHQDVMDTLDAAKSVETSTWSLWG
jgi:hypothetical protein